MENEGEVGVTGSGQIAGQKPDDVSIAQRSFQREHLLSLQAFYS